MTNEELAHMLFVQWTEHYDIERERYRLEEK